MFAQKNSEPSICTTCMEGFYLFKDKNVCAEMCVIGEEELCKSCNTKSINTVNQCL